MSDTPIRTPELLTRTNYMPGHEPIVAVDYQPTTDDYIYMTRAIELGNVALDARTTPVGAVLVHTPSGEKWEETNTEFIDDDLTGHPEITAYNKAKARLGRDLSQCSMYCVAEPCYGCTYIVDKGNLGTLYVAALRKDGEFFRNKEPDMDFILRRSRRSFTVISGLMLAEAQVLLQPDNNIHHRVP